MLISLIVKLQFSQFKALSTLWSNLIQLTPKNIFLSFCMHFFFSGIQNRLKFYCLSFFHYFSPLSPQNFLMWTSKFYCEIFSDQSMFFKWGTGYFCCAFQHEGKDLSKVENHLSETLQHAYIKTPKLSLKGIFLILKTNLNDHIQLKLILCNRRPCYENMP